MNHPIDDEILQVAQKINDGDSPFNDDKYFHSSQQKKLLAALKKINQISRHIRQQGEIVALKMNQGDHWAHLEIIKKIGQGGIGEVYCAYDPILDNQVAVKFLRPKSQLYITEKQFLDEARHMAKVRHPHVLAIHGATKDQNISGYWSDYLDGQLLSEMLAEQVINWNQQLKFALHLCQAVKAIHHNQLVHGDIKALNTMVQPERGAILLDFGSSRKHNTQASEDYIHQASPMAMAPEQFQGKNASKATDVFSLGLVFWQLTAKQHPLENMPLDDIKNRIEHLHEFKRDIQGPKAWQQLVLRMVDPNPQSRPLISDVERALNRIQNSSTRRAKQIATTAVLVLAVGITSISLYSNHKTNQAQQETQAMNTILSDILMKSSPIADGKDVLLIDVLADAESALIKNQKISKQQKTESLMQLVRTYRHQGKHQLSIDLATQLLSDPELSDSNRLDLLMQKSAGLNENKNYAESETLLQEAIKIEPITDQDATAQLSALITLIYTYNESYQLEKVPPLIKHAKTLWHRSAKKEAALANIYLVEGNHYEIKEQYLKAHDFYQQAVANFTIFYGDKNLDTLIAQGAAATVLTYDANNRAKGIEQLETVVQRMTDFLGAEHTSTLIARINMADAYSQLGNHQQAIDSIVPYMPYVEQAYGEHGGMTLTFKNMIAGYYQHSGNTETAKTELQDIIAIQQQKNGKHSQQAMTAQLKLVAFFSATEQLADALQLADDIHQISVKTLPKNNRIHLDAKEHIIWINHLLGDQQAATAMAALIQEKTATLGADDPATLSATKRLTEIKN